MKSKFAKKHAGQEFFAIVSGRPTWIRIRQPRGRHNVMIDTIINKKTHKASRMLLIPLKDVSIRRTPTVKRKAVGCE